MRQRTLLAATAADERGQKAAGYRLDLTYSTSNDGDAPSSMVAKVASTDETSGRMALATAA